MYPMYGPHIEGPPARLDHATVTESGPRQTGPEHSEPPPPTPRDLQALVPTAPQPACGGDYAVMASAAISATTSSGGGTATAEFGAEFAAVPAAREVIGKLVVSWGGA
jgi:hypothetical protein